MEARGEGPGEHSCMPQNKVLSSSLPEQMDACWAGWSSPSKFWSIAAESRAKKEHMVVVCCSDTSRKIALSREPDHLTAAGTFPDFLSQM